LRETKTRQAVPPAPLRPAQSATVPPHPEAPQPANLNDKPSPVPLDQSDAHLDQWMDAQHVQSEGNVPSGPDGRVGRFAARLKADSSEIQSPPGYQIELAAMRLTYPVDITFSDTNEIYIAEAGGHTYGTKPEQAPPARILQLMPNRSLKVVYDNVVPMDQIRQHASSADMPEGLIPPVTGVTWHEGKLYIAHRSRYSVLDPKTGDFKTIINGLRSWGEFLNAKPIFDPNGKMVWFLSTQGNSGVIEDHWIKVIRLFNKPQTHEVPGEDVTLTGINFPAPTEGKGKPGEQPTTPTGVYVPLGTQTQEGQVIPGELICNGAFFRSDPDGLNTERIAWGLRSSFGYRYAPDGRLIMTQNSANPMKPRGIRFDYETVYEVVEGEWYGWPDFYSSIPITDQRFKVLGGPQAFVLTEDTHRRLLKGRQRPREPLATLPVHSAAEGMVFGRKEFGIPPEEILVAEMGSIVPLYKDAEWPPNEPGEYDVNVPAQKPAGVELTWPGFMVSRVNLKTGEHRPFLVNKSGKPASATGGGGLERPIQLEWGPDGALYVVDFGTINFEPSGMQAEPHTGVVWKVTRSR
jgi:glucose/arabinose dehydrogenase